MKRILPFLLLASSSSACTVDARRDAEGVRADEQRVRSRACFETVLEDTSTGGAWFDDVGSAVAENGDTVVVYGSFEIPELRVHRFARGGGWLPVERIAGKLAYRQAPTVRFDPAGEPEVLWADRDGSIRFAHLGAPGAAPVALVLARAESVSVASNAAGHLAIAWSDDEGAHVRRYDGAAWDEPEVVSGPGDARVQEPGSVRGLPLLTMSGTGDVLVAWEQGYLTPELAVIEHGCGAESPRDHTIVWSRRFVSGTGWGALVGHPSRTGREQGLLTDLELVGNGAGQARLSWREGCRSTQLISAGFLPNEGWGSSEVVRKTGWFDGHYGSWIMSEDGAVTLVAADVASRRGDGLMAIRHTPGMGWSPETVLVRPTGGAERSSASFLTVGHGGAVWLAASETKGDLNGVWRAEFSPASGWWAPEMSHVPAEADFQLRLLSATNNARDPYATAHVFGEWRRDHWRFLADACR